MSDWAEGKLGDVLTVKYGKDHKTLNAGKIPVLGSGGVMRYADKSLYDKKSILIPRKGSLNNIMYRDEPFWTVDTMFWTIVDEDKVIPKYLFYQLTQIDFNNLNVGSAVPSLTVPVINEIEVTLPPLPEQKAIASVLNSFDDKIDLLHRQNQTLEAMAETLFKEWFVVNAKEDWEKGTVLDFFKLQRGFDLPTQKRVQGNYPIIASSGLSGTHLEHKVKGPGVVTGRSGVIGNVFYIDEDFWPLNTSLFISEYRLAKPLFAYHLLKTLDLPTLNGGSAVPTLNRNDVHQIEVLLPMKREIDKFEKTVNPFFKKITTNHQQIQTLTKLRDTLLPKLMSGEVRVKE